MISDEIERIEKRLKELGQTKSEFAVALGAPENNASAYYNNWRTRGLPKTRLGAAADFLSTTIEWITRGERKLSVATDSYPSQMVAVDHIRRMHRDEFITACVTNNDRNFFVASMYEDTVQIILSIVTVPGGIKAETIKQLIEEGVISRRIRTSADEFERFRRGILSVDDLFAKDNEGFWDRIEIITHDSIYAPQVKSKTGEYHALPSQIGRIMEQFVSGDLDLDDLILLENIANRLSSKGAELNIFDSKKTSDSPSRTTRIQLTNSADLPKK